MPTRRRLSKTGPKIPRSGPPKPKVSKPIKHKWKYLSVAGAEKCKCSDCNKVGSIEWTTKGNWVGYPTTGCLPKKTK